MQCGIQEELCLSCMYIVGLMIWWIMNIEYYDYHAERSLSIDDHFVSKLVNEGKHCSVHISIITGGTCMIAELDCIFCLKIVLKPALFQSN